MELLYVWVDRYKNLSGGYKLTGKYDITHNKKEVTLRRNPTAIKDFYAENDKINITGIVGENGSGKSSLLKLILHIFYHSHLAKYKRESEIEIVQSYVLVEVEGHVYYLSTSGRIPHTVKIEGLPTSRGGIKYLPRRIFTMYFNYMLDSLRDDERDEWVEDIYHKADDYNVPCLLEPYKKNNEINISNLAYLTRQRLVLHQKVYSSNRLINKIFMPTKVKLTLDVPKIVRMIRDDFVNTRNVIDKYKIELSKVINIINHRNEVEQKLSFTNYKIKQETGHTKRVKFMEEVRSRLSDIDDIIRETLCDVPLFIINSIYVANKVDRYNEKEGRIKASIEFNGDAIYVRPIEKTHATLKLLNAIEYHKNLAFSKVNFNNYPHEYIVEDVPSCTPSWFALHFSDDQGRTVENLSSGEKAFFIFTATLLYQIQNILSIRKNEKSSDYKSILLLLDETDLGLHPKLQREYIYHIIESIKDTDGIDFHVICTSHSPFIVSDIPRDNILFLHEGTVSGLGEDIGTFGSNIHTLLHDSFFMCKEAMMGRFAEDKITKAFNLCTDLLKESDEVLRKIEKEQKNEADGSIISLKERYLKERGFLFMLHKTIGDEILATALYNNLLELDNVFGIKEPRQELEVDKIMQFIMDSPQLHDAIRKILQ